MSNKKAVFVTLADRKYLEYAKQVFAGAYFNAGWKGDYLLLAHNIPEKDLKWFRKKGILIYHCKPVFKERIAGTNPVIVSKFYLFTEYFKRWDHVIYYDADVIVRASLDRLLELDGFASVRTSYNELLLNEIIPLVCCNERKISVERYRYVRKCLEKKYLIKKTSFGAGMFSFSTNCIQKDSYNKLKKLALAYRDIAASADQLALNLYFYNKWYNLSYIYDLYIEGDQNQWSLKPDKIKAIAIHFIGNLKPWAKSNYFFYEWEKNYLLSNKMVIDEPVIVGSWTNKKIFVYSKYLVIRGLIFQIKNKYFSIIFFIERKFPRFFRVVKNLKRFFLDALLRIFKTDAASDHLEYWSYISKEQIKNFLIPGGFWGEGQDYLNPGRVLVRKSIKNLIEQKKRKVSVLDVGCATGLEYMYLSKENLDVKYTGLDYTSQMLDVARKNYPKINWVVGDVRSLPFKNSSFDVVLCRHVLEHLPDYKKAVKELLRVSKELIILDFFITPSERPQEKVLEKIFLPMSSRKVKVFHNIYSKNELINIIKLNGGRKITITENLTKNNENYDTIYKVNK